MYVATHCMHDIAIHNRKGGWVVNYKLILATCNKLGIQSGKLHCFQQSCHKVSVVYQTIHVLGMEAMAEILHYEI